jgi:predicted permease
VRALPGVRNAAYISFLPMQMGGGIWPVVMQGDEVRRERGNVASLRYVTPGFFDTMGVPIHAGRDVRDSDTADAPWVAVVSESFVARYFPEGGAIGRRFGFALGEREIVGVAGNVRNRGLEEESEPQVYVPAGQVEDGSLTFYAPKELVIAVSGERPAVAGAVRDVIRRADPDLPIANVQWLPDVVAGETASRGVQLRVLLAFAAMALLLAGVGLHGLLGFVVSERRREIGVRVALGAQRSGIARMVLGRAALIAGIGLAAGLALALMAGRMMTSILAGVPAADPVTAVFVVAVVGLVMLSGSLAPALRAARVDPVKALRAD